jgi:hypothetical protein
MKTEDTTNMQPTLDLLKKLKTEAPEIFEQAVVVGQWVWLEFTGARPSLQILVKLRKLGFHWNRRRRCWQHPCGTRAANDPRDSGKYEVLAATAFKLKE